MVELAFRVVEAGGVEDAASPSLSLTVELSAPGVQVDSVLLRSSVRIEAGRRAYGDVERERLRELFGGESVWARSAKSLVWATVTSLVPGFQGKTTCSVVLPCSYDLAVAAHRYLHGLGGGEVPLTLQFSGTVFHRANGALQVAPIAWDREAAFLLPVATFRDIVDAHFHGATILGVRRDVFERLDGYRRQRGLRTLDDALVELLGGAGARAGNGGVA
jgi:hypothetical protein